MKKSVSILLLMFITMQCVVVNTIDVRSDLSFGVSFNWLHSDEIIERGESFTIRWQWSILSSSGDDYIYGFKFVLHDNREIFIFGYDGNSYLIDEVPTSFEFVFRNYTDRIERQSFGILAYIKYPTDSYIGYHEMVDFIKITWIPIQYSGVNIEIPNYYYYIIIPLGIIGIIIFVFKYYYSCENVGNIQKKRCRVYLDSVTNELRQQKRIELYEKVREKTTKELFGVKK